MHNRIMVLFKWRRELKHGRVLVRSCLLDAFSSGGLIVGPWNKLSLINFQIDEFIPKQVYLYVGRFIYGELEEAPKINK